VLRYLLTALTTDEIRGWATLLDDVSEGCVREGLSIAPEDHDAVSAIEKLALVRYENDAYETRSAKMKRRKTKVE